MTANIINIINELNENNFCLHALESSRQAMTLADLDTGEYIHVNQAFVDFSGYTKEEIIGKSYKEFDFFANPDDEIKLAEYLSTYGHCTDYPIVLNTKNDGKRYAHLNMNIFKVNNKSYRFSIIDDKTELYKLQKKNTEVVNENKAIMDGLINLLDNSSHHIWMVDPYRHRLLYFNKSCENYFKNKDMIILKGMTPEELMNNDETVKEWHSYYDRAIREGSLTINYKPQEEDNWLAITILPLYFKDRLVGITSFADDITDSTKYKMALEESNEKINRLFNQAIMAISKIGELKDTYTAGHQKRVQELSIAIGKEIGLDDEVIDNIALGALIHDIGKIFVPSDILNKPGEITDNEFKIIQDHSENAHKILSNIDLPRVIPDMILQHHERLDGSGYPKGLKEEDILLEARIVAVADVVEAMNSHRPYRSALGIDAALNEIKDNRGTLYDPKIVDACVRLFTEKDFKFSI